MCRLVYELSQTQYGEAHSFKSIDATYHVPGQRPEDARVTHDHIPLRDNEITTHKGDVVKFLGKHWDGYASVADSKSNRIGFIPAFKVETVFKTYNYSSNIKT